MDLSPPNDLNMPRNQPSGGRSYGYGRRTNRRTSRDKSRDKSRDQSRDQSRVQSPIVFTDTTRIGTRRNTGRKITEIDTSKYSPVRASELPPLPDVEFFEVDTDDSDFNIMNGGFIQYGDDDRRSRKRDMERRGRYSPTRSQTSPRRQNRRSLLTRSPSPARTIRGESSLSRSPMMSRYTSRSPPRRQSPLRSNNLDEVEVINMNDHFEIDETYTNVIYTGKLQVITRNIMPNEYMNYGANLRSDLTIYVVAGNGELNIGERRERDYYDIDESDLGIIPAGVPFYIHNSGDSTLSLILTYSSGEFEYDHGTVEMENPSTGIPKLFL